MFNNKSPRSRAYIQLHIAVVLFGFTAILGDLITLEAVPLVWWRVILAGLSMIFMVRITSMVKEVGWKMISRFAGIGVITALHWVTFYASIKFANASIALVCLATTSLYTSLIEPAVLKTRLQWVDLAIGVVVVPAMLLIVSDLHGSMLTGVYCGIVSAILAATFVSFNKKYIHVTSPLRITFVEMVSSSLFLTVAVLMFYDTEAIIPTSSDWIYLIVLALLCTTLAQYLSMSSLKHISAFNSVLVVNLEPVYGIILASIILNEHDQLTTTFYIGAIVIVGVVFLYPLIKRLVAKRGIA